MSWWRRYLDWRIRQATRLEQSASGCVVRQGAEFIELDWSEVTRATAFKRDLLTVDLICIAFETETRLVEINEEMPGYLLVEQAMEQAFDLAPEWKLVVMFPPFETKPTLIYERVSLAA
jgi:hypothetical protein